MGTIGGPTPHHAASCPQFPGHHAHVLSPRTTSLLGAMSQNEASESWAGISEGADGDHWGPAPPSCSVAPAIPWAPRTCLESTNNFFAGRHGPKRSQRELGG